jgi:TonB family protein
MKYLALLLCFSFAGLAQAQTAPKTAPVTNAEHMPEFPGGQQGMIKYLTDNLKYPAEARAAKVQGKVVMQFTVMTDGSVDDIKCVSKPLGHGLEAEAERAMANMPRWKPGSDKGKPVPVVMTLPVSFRL